MAVHTPLTLAGAHRLAARWGLDVTGVEPIAEGTLNTSHALIAGGRRYFLRTLEHVDRSAAEAEARLLARLGRAGAPVPAPLALVDEPGAHAADHAGKPALVLTWIDGAIACARDIGPAHAHAVGDALARLHRAGAELRDAPAPRFDPLRLAARLAVVVVPAARPDLRPTIDRLHRRLVTSPGLPVRGVIHGDLFRENVLWFGTAVAGLVDFEAACFGNFAVDLMIAALAWGFTDRFDGPRLRAFMRGYTAVRPLTADERGELHPAAQLAALRFATTRLLDYELGAVPGGWRDHRPFLARLDALDALGPAGWRDLLGR